MSGKNEMFLKKEVVITGLCNRIAQKFGVNTFLVRLALLFVMFFISFVPTIIAYFALNFVGPFKMARENSPTPNA